MIINEPLKDLRVVEGETAKFQCKVKNPKNYPILWYRKGEEIKVPSDKFVTFFLFSIIWHLLTTLVVQREQENGIL